MITQVTNEDMKRLADWLDGRPSFVVLGFKGMEVYGVIENSFSMGLSSNRVNIFWSGKATDNIFGSSYILDGKKAAESHKVYYASNHPDMRFEVYEINSPDCPIKIDWVDYLDAHTPSSKTLSGVKDKFRARNALFAVKESTEEIGC